MPRELVRIATIDSIRPIKDADAIEAACVGGWTIVVKKGEFRPGDHAVYFEIDSFLPQGNPAWQFLVDKSSLVYQGTKGHVLRTVKMRGQVSQGLLLSMAVLGNLPNQGAGTVVTNELGVLKYVKPLPAELEGVARGYLPSRVPTTDQERIQNLANELVLWQTEGDLWEITEKLEGASTSFAHLDDEVHVCSHLVDLLDTEGNVLWGTAHALDVPAKLLAQFCGRNVTLQGELVGAGIEGNIYALKGQSFYLYDVYDSDSMEHLSRDARMDIAHKMGVPHTPLIDPAFRMGPLVTMESLLAMADGPSVLRPTQAREGIVFKRLDGKASFKVVSNKYLLKQKV